MFWGFWNWGPFRPSTMLRLLYRNPLTSVVYALLSKWYVITMVGAIVVTYWVFKGLKDAGVIDAAETILVRSLGEIKGVAQNCTPKITDLHRFWNCLSDPANSRYVPTNLEIQLQEEMMKQREDPEQQLYPLRQDPPPTPPQR